MFDQTELISDLRELFARDGDLSGIAERRAFRAFLGSDLMAERMHRFQDTTFRPGETAGLYSDNTVVFVLDEDEWRVTLARHASMSELIYSLPFPSLIGPVGPASQCAIDVFAYDPTLDQDLSGAAGSRAQHLRRVALEPGQFWACSRKEPAYRLVDQSPSTVFLRITGPMTSPYSHAFHSTTLEYAFSGFSTPEVTGMDVASNLFVAAARSEAFSAFTREEAAAVADLMDRYLSYNVTAPRSGWYLVQAMHTVAPERSLSLLRTLAASDGPLADVARRTLEAADVGR
jgi:hypothetical protein